MGKLENKKKDSKNSHDEQTKPDTRQDKKNSLKSVVNISESKLSKGDSEVAKIRSEVEQLHKTIETMQVKLREVEGKEAVPSQVDFTLASKVESVEQCGWRHSFDT